MVHDVMMLHAFTKMVFMHKFFNLVMAYTKHSSLQHNKQGQCSPTNIQMKIMSQSIKKTEVA